MNIVLVHPHGSNWVPGQTDTITKVNCMPPVGIISLAAFVEQKGHKVYVVDCLGPRGSHDPIVNTKTILSHKPDLVGFSTTTSSFLNSCDITSLIKQANPKIKIIFGGVHISALGAKLLETYQNIDYLVTGEGEVTLEELANGKELSKINGLIYRDKDEIITNPPRTGILELDTLPFPAYEKLQGFPADYRLPLFNYIHTPGSTMITSRGCPYQCSYCDRSVFKRSFRYNSAEYIYDHIKYQHGRFGVRHINIYDDLFTANRKRITALCERLAQDPINVQFNCAVRVGHTDDELLEMLKAAGCLMVSLGIESADEGLLKRHKAGVSLDQVRDTTARIQKHGLRAKGLFIMGLPGDTEETIKKTCDFVISLGLDDMNMTKFTPFPGAPCWDTIHEDGSFEEDWNKMNCMNFVFIPKDIDSKETLEKLYNKHVKNFYSHPVWRKKFRKNMWHNRNSLWRVIKNLPSFLSMKKQFEPEK